MRLVFMGTPEFAVPSLEALLNAGHQILLVITQPDRPKGRGKKLTPPPVKEAALRHGLPVLQPEKVREPTVVERLKMLKPDAIVVVGYGQIIPKSIIDIPRYGIINVHASLLPAYRGAAPVQWAIVHGEKKTGVTTMLIDEGLDTGDILLQRATTIGEEETAVELGQRLATMGAELLVETLEGLEKGTIKPKPQDHSRASYAPMIKKSQGQIDWKQPAEKIFHLVRGMQPWPGAFTYFRGKLFHIWRARLSGSAGQRPPGTLFVDGRRLLVSCGDDRALELVEVQLEGRKRMPAEDFMRGYRIAEGERLGDGPSP